MFLLEAGISCVRLCLFNELDSQQGLGVPMVMYPEGTHMYMGLSVGA